MATSSRVFKAIAVTAELCGGREFSEAAVKQFAADLSAYPEESVLKALDRCRRELQRSLTLAAVLERIDDGRPGPEEAWSMLPHDEDTTAVWTTEMAEAWGIVRDLERDPIAMRMAFKEAYLRIMGNARATGAAPIWQASLGWDARGREAVLVRAVEQGRLSRQHVERVLLPYYPDPEMLARVLARGKQLLLEKAQGEDTPPREKRVVI